MVVRPRVRRLFVALSSIGLLATAALRADDVTRGDLERMLELRRALAERHGRPAPPTWIRAEELEGRDVGVVPAGSPAGIAAAGHAAAAPAAEVPTAPERTPQTEAQRSRDRVGAAEQRLRAEAERMVRPLAVGAATLSGRVVRAADGAGVADLAVRLDEIDTGERYEVPSGAGGAFAFAGVAAGRYALSCAGSDFLVGVLHDGQLCPSGICAYNPEDPIEIAEDAVLDGFELALPAGGVIAGVVTKPASGEALAGSEPVIDSFVYAVQHVTDGLVFEGSGFTDADGSFRLTGLPLGNWNLGVAGDHEGVGALYPDLPCPAGRCVYGAPSPGPVVVIADAVTTADFALERGGAVAGTLRPAAGGDLIPGPYVEVYDASAERHFQLNTGLAADGTYRTLALPAGSYLVVAYGVEHYLAQLYDGHDCATGFDSCGGVAGDPVTVVAGMDTVGVDFDLTAAGRIVGQLSRSDTGAAVEGTVEVYAADGRHVQTGFTDGTGHYEAGGLPAGSYRLFAADHELALTGELYADRPCHRRDCDLTAGDLVAVTGGEATTIDVALDPFGTLAGTVLGVMTAPAGGGDPLRDAVVEAFTLSGRMEGRAVTMSDGSWSMLLPAGVYVVTFAADGFRPGMYDGITCPRRGCDRALGTSIELAGGATVDGIDAVLELGPSLAGRVTVRASGAPVRNAAVDVRMVTAEGALLDAIVVSTDAAGRWRAEGLDPGLYTLRVRPGAKYRPLAWPDVPCDFLVCTGANSGEIFALAAGEARGGADFAVARAVVVQGRVRSAANGGGVRFGTAALWDVDRNSAVTAALTAHGGYRVGSLPPGRYRIQVAPGLDRLLGQAWPDAPCPLLGCSDAGDVVTLDEPGIHRGYDFFVGPAAIVTGRIVDAATGDGLVNALVAVSDLGLASFPGIAFTNPDGSFRIGGLAPASTLVGTFTSQIDDPFFAPANHYVDELLGGQHCPELFCDPRSAEVLELAVGRRDGVRLEVDRGATVRATLAGAEAPQIWLLDLAGGFRQLLFAESAGQFVRHGVPPGKYYLYAPAVGVVPTLYPDQPCLRPACDLSRGELVLVGGPDDPPLSVDLVAAGPGESLTVRVLAGVPGLPQGGASVDVYDQDGLRVASGEPPDSGALRGTTKFSGTLPAGRYYVRARAPGYVPTLYPNVPCANPCDVTRGTPVEVGPGLEPEVTIRLTVPEARLRGRLLGEDGTPLPGLGVFALDAERGQPNGVNSQWDGSFYLDQLPAGTFYLAGLFRAAGWVPELRDDVPCNGEACDPTAGIPVAVAEGEEVTELDLVVARGGSVGGTVRDAADGMALGGIVLQVRNLAGDVVSNPVTSPDGRWRSSGLPAGGYRVRSRDTVRWVDATLGGETCDPDCPSDQGDVVEVVGTERVEGIDLALMPE